MNEEWDQEEDFKEKEKYFCHFCGKDDLEYHYKICSICLDDNFAKQSFYILRVLDEFRHIVHFYRIFSRNIFTDSIKDYFVGF
jgi:hypothetical protein